MCWNEDGKSRKEQILLPNWKSVLECGKIVFLAKMALVSCLDTDLGRMERRSPNCAVLHAG
jgi:hypothetical protein